MTPMAKTLFAVDELTGLITATALVRPTKSVHEVEARSVRKKMKDKAFARGVSREDVINGAAELGVDLDEHIRVRACRALPCEETRHRAAVSCWDCTEGRGAARELSAPSALDLVHSRIRD